MFNQAIIMGRITSDPELRITNSGISVCTFTVAVPRKSSKEITDFITVNAWRQTAEFVAKYFRKGRMILVVGSFQSRNYTDKNGINRISWAVQATEVSFCGDKSNDNEYSYTASNSNYQEPSGTLTANEFCSAELDLSDDDLLPF